MNLSKLTWWQWVIMAIIALAIINAVVATVWVIALRPQIKN
jgi:hypothetical protein